MQIPSKQAEIKTATMNLIHKQKQKHFVEYLVDILHKTHAIIWLFRIHFSKKQIVRCLMSLQSLVKVVLYTHFVDFERYQPQYNDLMIVRNKMNRCIQNGCIWQFTSNVWSLYLTVKQLTPKLKENA